MMEHEFFAQSFSQNRSVCESLYFGWCLENTHGQNLLPRPFSKRWIKCTRVVSSGFLYPALNILVNRDLTTFLLRYSTFILGETTCKNSNKRNYNTLQFSTIKSKASLWTHLWKMQALVCCCWLALIKQMILVKSNRYRDLKLDHQVQINELFERCSHSPSALIEGDSPVKQSQANHSYIKWLFSFYTLLPLTSLGKWCSCLITEKAHKNLASPTWASPWLVMNKARPSAQNIITTLVIRERHISILFPEEV